MAWLLLLLLGAGGLVAARGQTSTHLFPRTPRSVVYADGTSTPARLSRLRLVFGPRGVVDEGAGVYTVTPDIEITWTPPEGARIEGSSPSARAFVSAVIRKMLEHGKPHKQAIAIALNAARRRGFVVGVSEEEGNRWHAIHYRWSNGRTAWGKPFWSDRWTAMQLTPGGSETWRYIGGAWSKLW